MFDQDHHELVGGEVQERGVAAECLENRHTIGETVDGARFEILELVEGDPGLLADRGEVESAGGPGLAQDPGQVGNGRGLGFGPHATDGSVTVQDHRSPRHFPGSGRRPTVAVSVRA